MNEKIEKAIRAAQLRPLYDRWCANKNDEARAVIDGRSHYYDKDTMGYFRCNVQRVRTSEHGVFMGTISTQSANFNHTSRTYRIAFHDLTGHTLNTSELGDLPTKAKAEKAFNEFWDSLDEMTVLREALQRAQQEAKRNAKYLAAGLAHVKGR